MTCEWSETAEKMKKTATIFSLISLTALVASCDGGGGSHNKPDLEYMPHMMDSPAVKAQRPGPFGEGMRVAPDDTIARNSPEPYRFANDPDAAGRELKNPLPRDKASMLKGQKYYNTYCIVCHGVKGEGNGTVVPKFPMPPSLHSQKVREWSDGRIYHVITMGQNLMPSYASQVTREERWAIIHYVRALQRSLNPTAADLKEAGR